MLPRLKFVRTLSLISFFYLFSSCTLGPDYKKPNLPFDDSSWIKGDKNRQEDAGSVDKEWWKGFKDPELTRLIQEAQQSNYDIRISEKNLERSRAFLTQSEASLFPNLSAEGSATRRQLSETAGIPVGPGNPRIQNFYSAGLTSNWEIDIFGGRRRAIAAAYARYQSLDEKRRDTLLMVAAEVARRYIELRGAQKRYAILKENVELQKKTADLVKKRFDAGEASSFDYSRVLAQLQSTEAQLPNTEAEVRTLIYRLSILCGKVPEKLMSRLSLAKALPLNPRSVPLGLRSDIFRRRPDVRAAERKLEAQIQDIGARTADLFPKFTLTGSIGYQSIGEEDFTSERSQVWSIGPGLSWPIFNAGFIRAQIRAEEVEGEMATLEYEKTVLLAIADAESAFTDYGYELETTKKLRKAVATRNKNISLSRKRYESGLESLINLIDTEGAALMSQQELVVSETKSLIKLVKLYKSLGGGWQALEKGTQ